MQDKINGKEISDEAQKLLDDFWQNMEMREATKKTYNSILRCFFSWYESSGRPLYKMTGQDCKDFMEAGDDASSSTAGTRLAAMRKFFLWIKEKGGDDLTEGITPPKKRQVFVRLPLTAEQARELMGAVKRKRDRAIIALMLTTGLREVEIVRLNISDLVSDIFVSEDGSGKARWMLKVWGKGRDAADAMVVIPAATWEVLREYLSTRYITAADEPLFVGEGNKNKGGRLTTRSIQITVTTAMHAIGLSGKEYSTHSLRHTAAVAAIKGGADLKDVQYMLRHRDPSGTEHYLQTIMKDRRVIEGGEDKAAKYLEL